jgi:NitT/TauT family transport system substrate-binding protein
MSFSVRARLSATLAALLLALPAQAQELKPWRQAMILPKADAGFFLMAAKRGFAEREGLKIDVLGVKDDPIGMKALLAGEVDSYDGVYGAIAASARGADVKLLGCNWHAAPYVLLARGGIGTVGELKGKSIAASSPGTPPDMVARAALVQAKVPLDEVKIAAVGGDRDRFTALVGGVVDAAVVSNEYLPLPSSKNLKMLVTGRDAGPNFLRVCMFSTGKVLAERHEDAVRFLTAQSKALRYAVSHREATLKLTFQGSDAKPDDPRPAFVFDDAVKTNAVAPDLPIPTDKIAWMEKQLVAIGEIPRAGDISTMIDTGIRSEAMKRVGN